MYLLSYRKGGEGVGNLKKKKKEKKDAYVETEGKRVLKSNELG